MTDFAHHKRKEVETLTVFTLQKKKLRHVSDVSEEVGWSRPADSQWVPEGTVVAVLPSEEGGPDRGGQLAMRFKENAR